ncbi:MAG: C4-type zinc ribbon domain-containing protein [Candidatus Omnitrophota bacterium]
MDLKAQLTQLIKLQEFDSEIYGLKAEIEAMPAAINALEAVFEEKKKNMAALEKNLLDLQKQRKDKELELATKEEANKKLQGQLYTLKTNKEFQTMLQQIGLAKADASVIEDKILELFDKADLGKSEVEKEKERLKAQEQQFNQEKKLVQERIKVIEERLAQLEAQRQQAAVGIDPKISAQYNRILQSRDGLAIVLVKNNSCGGCNMLVPPQVINLIKMYEHIVTCEMCNRMLYVDESR